MHKVLAPLATKFFNGNGEWNAGNYWVEGTWEKSQWPAISDAILANLPTGATYPAELIQTNPSVAEEAKVAVATVNAAIALHQQTSGSLSGDFGTSASVVNGTFWAEAEGLIGYLAYTGNWVGHGWIDNATLQSWEQSMVRYSWFLVTSGNNRYYVNGNVNLGFATIFLETYQLTLHAHDTAQQPWMEAFYEQERDFVTNPCAQATCPIDSHWGWNQSGNTGWFSETPWWTRYVGDWGCDNGQSPCVGFDPYYMTLQMDDAIIGYVLSGYDSWWGNIVTSEIHALLPRMRGAVLDDSGGSRKSGLLGSDLPFWSVWAVLDEHNIESHDDLWQAQQSYLAQHFQWDVQQPSLGANDYAGVASSGLAILDAEQER